MHVVLYYIAISRSRAMSQFRPRVLKNIVLHILSCDAMKAATRGVRCRTQVCYSAAHAWAAVGSSITSESGGVAGRGGAGNLFRRYCAHGRSAPCYAVSYPEAAAVHRVYTYYHVCCWSVSARHSKILYAEKFAIAYNCMRYSVDMFLLDLSLQVI